MGLHKGGTILNLALQVSLLYLIRCQTIPGHFYPFGLESGDLTAPANDDRSYGPIPLSLSFHYFNEYHDTLYINTNGVISFAGPVTQYTPASFPIESSPMIAPFWADIDTSRNDGAVFFRSSVDPGLLTRASTDVRAHASGFSTFKASWLFITTWENVTYYGGDSSTSINTFQSVLVTNGLQSFALFNYGDMAWTTGSASGGVAGLGGVPAQAGFNAGDGTRYSMIPESQTAAILEVPSTTNVGLNGRWFFRVDGQDVHGGCSSLQGKAIPSPRFGSILGGKPIYITGPCYPEASQVVCRFGDKDVQGVLEYCRAKCIVPQQWNNIKKTVLKLSIDGGKTFEFSGEFIYIEEEPTFALERTDGFDWNDENYERKFTVKWEPSHFPDVGTVNLDFVTFEITDTVVNPIATRLVSGLTNDGSEDIPNTLADASAIALSLYGALRITPVDTSQVGEVALWSDLHLSIWFLKMEVAALLRTVISTSNFPRIVPINFPNGDNFNLAITRVDLTSAILTFQTNNPTVTTVDQLLASADTIANDVIQSLALDMCSTASNTDQATPADFTSVPTPPCTLQQALVDPNFEPDLNCNFGAGCEYTLGAFHCIRSESATSTGTGQHSCFSSAANGGQLLALLNGGGAVHRYHYTTLPPFVGNFFFDLMPKVACCILRSDACFLYQAMRPTTSCTGYSPPNPAFAGGDPIIQTLDKLEQTFLEIGEYWLMKDFVAAQAIRAPNVSIDASVWKALFARVPDSDKVLVNAVNGFLTVSVNDVFQDFSDLTTQSYKGVKISLDNNLAQLRFYDMAINVTLIQDVIYLSFLVGPSFKGKTSGLLGNYNGDPTDDNVPIEQFRIPASENIFPGGTIAQNPNYKPVAISERDLRNQSPEIVTLCQGHLACLRDYYITGNREIAMATLQALTQQEVLKNSTKPVVSCGFPPSPPHGFIDVAGHLVGNWTTFRCSSGFAQEGSTSTVCQARGSWTSYTTSCNDINECNKQPCGEGHCENTMGSYNCSCNEGTILRMLPSGPTCMRNTTTTALQKRYNCYKVNPCNPLVVPNTLFYRHDSNSFYVECLADGSCLTKICPHNNYWDQGLLQCVAVSHIK